MPENACLISVVLPVYNGGKLLRDSVESVLRQTMQDFELLIGDDGSTDGSYEYLQSINDHRVKLTSNEKNLGLFGNLNMLVNQAKSGLIRVWAQDDVMYLHCLDRTHAFHAKHPNIPYSLCEHDDIDGDSNIIHRCDQTNPTPELISPDLHYKITSYVGPIAANISLVAFRKKCFEESGPFRSDLRFSGDFEMWERIGAGQTIGYLRETLIQLRSHTNQLSQKVGFQIQQLKDDMVVVSRMLARSTGRKNREAKRALAWHRHVYYFNVLLGLLRKGHWRFGFEYYKELRKHLFLPAVAMRWLAVRICQSLFKKRIDPIDVAKWMKELEAEKQKS